MNLQMTLAARYLGGRKLRTALTTLAVIFGVLLVFGMNTILPAMVTALQANIQGMQGNVDFTITNISGGSFSTDVAARLQGLDGVRAASASLQRTVNLPADFADGNPARPDTLTAVNLIGITPEAARSIRAYAILHGRFLEASDSASAVISQTLADALSVNLGDTFRLPSAEGTTRLTVVGLLPGRMLPGNEEVLVNLPQAQKMVAEPGKVNIIELNVETFAGKARRAEIERTIQAALGDHYQVGTLMTGDEFFASMQLAQIMFSLFGVLAEFMGGFIIFNTFRTVISERRRDIGMLRALGATRRTVVGIILAEGLIQGLIGSVVGMLLGYLLAAGVLQLAQGPLSQFVNLKLGAPVVSPLLVGISLLLGVGVTVFAGLLPALNASKITPLEALRPSLAEVEYKRQTGKGFVAGVVLLILATAAILSERYALIIPGGILFLVGLVLVTPALVRPFAALFGRFIAWMYTRQGIGGLAQSNLTRAPSRVAVTASASMLGLAVIVAAGGLVTSMSGSIFDMLRQSLGSDYLLMPPSLGIWGSDVGANAGFAGQLRDIRGVDEVSTFRYASSMANGQAVSLLGIDPVAFPQVSGLHFMEGGPSVYNQIASGRALIANGAFMLATGARVGDTVELVTSEGEAPYRIAAVATDLLNAKMTTAFISQANLQADFGSSEDVFIQINLEKDADRQAVGAQIKKLAADYPQFKLIMGAEYFQAIKTMGGAAFSGIYILFAILAFPSLIAMLNTLTIGVIERTREIGMIRAVGGTRKQVRNMVVAEALLLAVIGTAFGIMGGVYLGYAFVSGIKIMFPMGYFFPWTGILAAVVVGLLFGALAALVPARQAAQLDIVEALRYE
jgi:putative ABC transport system permease protein